jgi:hypothetical protein
LSEHAVKPGFVFLQSALMNLEHGFVASGATLAWRNAY